MKSIIFASALLLSVLTVSSCGESKEKSESEAKVYHCPMSCEGDKTYSEAGSCPVCKMDLEEKK